MGGGWLQYVWPLDDVAAAGAAATLRPILIAAGPHFHCNNTVYPLWPSLRTDAPCGDFTCSASVVWLPYIRKADVQWLLLLLLSGTVILFDLHARDVVVVINLSHDGYSLTREYLALLTFDLLLLANNFIYNTLLIDTLFLITVNFIILITYTNHAAFCIGHNLLFDRWSRYKLNSLLYIIMRLFWTVNYWVEFKLYLIHDLWM